MLSNVVSRKKSTGEYGVYEKYRKGTYKAKTIWTEIEIIDDEDDDDTIDALTWEYNQNSLYRLHSITNPERTCP